MLARFHFEYLQCKISYVLELLRRYFGNNYSDPIGKIMQIYLVCNHWVHNNERHMMTNHQSHKYFQFEFCSSQWVDTELQVYYCIFIIS